MRAGIEEQQQNVMMIATIQKRHEDELAAVRKDISAYEERCDKLEKEKIDIEMNLEKVQRDMEILQQKCKLGLCDNIDTPIISIVGIVLR